MKKRFSEEQIIGFLREADAKRLRHLEMENARLKKLLVETLLEAEVSRDAQRRKW